MLELEWVLGQIREAVDASGWTEHPLRLWGLSDTGGQSQLCEQLVSKHLLPASQNTFSESTMCWAVWEDDSGVESQCNQQ